MPAHDTPLLGVPCLLDLEAAANRHARRTAFDDAAPRWWPLDAGTLYVSLRSLYFESWSGVREWSLGGIDVAYMTGRGRFQFSGVSDAGSEVRWIVTSPWAELGFALWAIERRVPHPHLLTLFPEEWRDRARARGLDLPELDP